MIISIPEARLVPLSLPLADPDKAFFQVFELPRKTSIPI